MTHLSDTSQVCICSSDDFKIHMKPNADCLAQHLNPAQPMQDEASSAPLSRPLEGSGLAAQHAEVPQASAAFTPGEWRVHTYSNYLGWSIYAGGCIAERWYQSDRTESQNKEMRANAHLIAAAPEMYAALQMVECAISGINPDGTYRGDGIGFNDDECAQIQAAIAKATGGAA